MNVPEALRATEQAINGFEKAVLEAREQLASEMHRIHNQLLEEQPVMAEISEDYAMRKART